MKYLLAILLSIQSLFSYSQSVDVLINLDKTYPIYANAEGTIEIINNTDNDIIVVDAHLQFIDSNGNNLTKNERITVDLFNLERNESRTIFAGLNFGFKDDETKVLGSFIYRSFLPAGKYTITAICEYRLAKREFIVSSKPVTIEIVSVKDQTELEYEILRNKLRQLFYWENKKIVENSIERYLKKFPKSIYSQDFALDIIRKWRVIEDENLIKLGLTVLPNDWYNKEYYSFILTKEYLDDDFGGKKDKSMLKQIIDAKIEENITKTRPVKGSGVFHIIERADKNKQSMSIQKQKVIEGLKPNAQD